MLCTPGERINCNTKAQYQRITVPTDGGISVGHYHLRVLCKAGYCTGALTKSATITANSGTLNQKSQTAAQNNPVYQTVKTGYLGKDGYSKTQAYMHSFTGTGTNASFAECVLGAKGYIASGVYYSCDGKEHDGFGQGCHDVKSCMQYHYKAHTDTSHKTCDITPGKKESVCTKTPVVTVKKVPFVKPVPTPCSHIVVMNAKSTPPKDARIMTSFKEGFWVFNFETYNVYNVPGQSGDKACYLPGSLHVEHDRNQHGTSQIDAIADAIYLFDAQSVYVYSGGYADLSVQENGHQVAHVNADSNTGVHSTSLIAKADTSYVLNGTNQGLDDYSNAYSIYWASTPAHQEIKKAVITWQQTCPEGGSDE